MARLYKATISQVNTILSGIVIVLFKFYSYFISPILKPRCRFLPTCAEYAVCAVKRHGVWVGLYLTLNRILHCHPFSKRSGYDPVPANKT